MASPLYDGCQIPQAPGDGHKGLWFERFFDRYDENWGIPKRGKQDWINTVAGLYGDGDALRSACRTREMLGGTLGGRVEAFETTWHFATGLGNPHPVENGFAWHPTLGVPYLTGAAVKGLVRAWVDGWMAFEGKDDKEQKNNRLATLYRWFGSEHKDPKQRDALRKEGFTLLSPNGDLDTEAGAFIFFDAIPVGPVTLVCDVMTPHYGKWYEMGGEITDVKTQPDCIPADWHDPVPVPFLVVKKATFLFCIAPRKKPLTDERKDAVKTELNNIMQALTDALQFLGAGAKTAVGYGSLKVDEAERKRRAQRENQARLDQLDPHDRMREEAQLLTSEQIATMFGNNFRNTTKTRGESLTDFVRCVLDVHGEVIRSWKDSPDKNKRKSYKRLLSEGEPS